MKPREALEGRRLTSRIDAKLPITLIRREVRTGREIHFSGETINLSASGIKFHIRDVIPHSSVTDLRIEPPAPMSPFYVRGWLIWENHEGGIYGAQLLDPPEEWPKLMALLSTTSSNASVVKGRRSTDQAGETLERRQADHRSLPVERRSAGQRRSSRLEFGNFDRRSSLRIRFNASVEMDGLGESVKGKLESLSDSGVRFYSRVALQEEECRLKITGEGVLLDLPVRLQWDYPYKDGFIYGASFSSLTDDEKRSVRTLIANKLREPNSVADRRLQNHITSDLVSYRNAARKEIIAYHDHRADPTYTQDPLIVMPPGYSETKKDALQAAYYLVTNGFQVLRYDGTNHTGESEGDILHITLKNFEDDLVATLDHAEKRMHRPQVGVVATSLSARVALKAAKDPRVIFFLGLVPAVDVQYTLNAVYREDLVGTYRAGKLWGVTNVLGCNTYLDDFLQDLIDHQFDSLASTCEDARRVKCPVVLLAAEKDPWVRFQDVQSVMASVSSESKEIHLIPAMHQLKENPRAAQAALRQMVASALKYMMGIERRPLEVKEPAVRWLGVQNRIERQRLKLLSLFEKKEHQDFWAHYLAKFHFVSELPDYRRLMTDLFASLHGLHPGEKVLDAGCGNGTFGMWVLTSLALESKGDSSVLATTEAHPIQMTCVDYVDPAVQLAESNHRDLQAELFAHHASHPLQFNYHRADLEESLPFQNDSFDKVHSNLVISYLKDPVSTLREFRRVLKSGGRCVVSTLKPYADTSEIYRHYVDLAPGLEKVENTRQLLNNAGDIKRKETEGHFNFFSEDDLLSMAREAGFETATVIRSFGDQANVLIAIK